MYSDSRTSAKCFAPLRSLLHKLMKRHFISISPLHTFTTPFLRQKTLFLLLIIIIIRHYVYHTRFLKNYIFLFSFHHYLNNVAIMRKRCFFHFATTFTTSWSREKFFSFCCCAHYAMIKRYLFLFCYYVHYTMIKRKNVFFI